MRVAIRCRTADDELLQGEGCGTLVAQHDIAAVSPRAVDGTVVLEDILGAVQLLIQEHAPVAADHVHEQLARLDLAKGPVAKRLGTEEATVFV